MRKQLVVGIYRALGEAQDAYHRLVYEGLPEDDVRLRVLKEATYFPGTLARGREESFWDYLLGSDLPERHVKLLHNGETAVYVRAESGADATWIADILTLYNPLDIDRTEIDDSAAAPAEKVSAP